MEMEGLTVNTRLYIAIGQELYGNESDAIDAAAERSIISLHQMSVGIFQLSQCNLI